MKIARIEAWAVTVPIEAPLRHSYGVHQAFTRTVVVLHTDDGLTGLAETAASPEQVHRIGSVAIGLSPYDLELIRMRISQRFYWSREPLVAAAIELACVDIQGKAAGVPAYRLLGGKLRPGIQLAAYCFYRYGSPTHPAVGTPEQLATHAAELVARYGFTTVKLKGGVLEPEQEVRTLAALRDRLGPRARLRFDPNAAWQPGTAAYFVPQFEHIGLEYLEDPSPGIEGMAAVRSRTRLPLATNMCVVDFPELVPAVRRGAVDVVLSDPWYWGGPTRTRTLAQMCAALGVSVGMHSGIELGMGMAAMSHIGVTIPNLTYAVDAHYHHLTDDVVAGPRLLPVDGALAPPEGPGWGVSLDEDKLARYRELHDRDGHANLYVSGVDGQGPDPWRPSWYPAMPAW
jgi:glucarate dehydratase